MEKRNPEDGQTPDLYLEREDDLLNDLDPHLQELILAQRAGEVPDSSIVTDVNGVFRVDVIAKLRNPEEEVPGFQVVSTIGDIVTGSVALPDIERVRRHDNVRSLKAATRVQPMLDASVPEVRCDAATLRNAFPDIDQGIDGRGVIVGIVDIGCDFAHRSFLDGSSSRILSLWDQRERNATEQRPVRPTAPSPAGFGYGREFTQARLNDALAKSDPYADIDYELAAAAHGTHVMDIAAGNGQNGQPGVAPRASLIFVHVDIDDVADSESLGNSRRLLEAVEYIFRKAGSTPVVVNLSLGTHGGPKDGSTLVEQALDRQLETAGRATVIAAGNSFNLRSHAQGTVQPGQPVTLSWEIIPFDRTPNELEVWYDFADGSSLEVTLTAPNGTSLGPVPVGETHVIRNQNGMRVGRVIHRRRDPNNGDRQIDILLQPSLSSGSWKVRLEARGSQPVPFHAWIERDDFGQSTFTAQQESRTHTLGSISCGRRTIAVGSYDPRDPQRRLSGFSASGPTRDGRAKPDVSAPGQDIVAARARGGTTQKQGTSMAAPHVTGLVALMLQVNGALSAQKILDALKSFGTAQPARRDRAGRTVRERPDRRRSGPAGGPDAGRRPGTAASGQCCGSCTTGRGHSVQRTLHSAGSARQPDLRYLSHRRQRRAARKLAAGQGRGALCRERRGLTRSRVIHFIRHSFRPPTGMDQATDHSHGKGGVERPPPVEGPQPAADQGGREHGEAADQVIEADGAPACPGGGEVEDERLARRLAGLPQAAHHEGGGQRGGSGGGGERQREKGEEGEGQEDERLAVHPVGHLGDRQVDKRGGDHLDAGQPAELDRGAAQDVDDEEEDEDLGDALGPARQDVGGEQPLEARVHPPPEAPQVLRIGRRCLPFLIGAPQDPDPQECEADGDRHPGPHTALHAEADDEGAPQRRREDDRHPFEGGLHPEPDRPSLGG